MCVQKPIACFVWCAQFLCRRANSNGVKQTLRRVRPWKRDQNNLIKVRFHHADNSLVESLPLKCTREVAAQWEGADQADEFPQRLTHYLATKLICDGIRLAFDSTFLVTELSQQLHLHVQGGTLEWQWRAALQAFPHETAILVRWTLHTSNNVAPLK